MHPLSSENCDRYQPLFSRYHLTIGRQLPEIEPHGRRCADRLVIRHADIFGVCAGYVWHGGLDLGLDTCVLREIARELGEPLYVLREAVRRSLRDPLSVEQLTRLSDWNTRDGQRR